MAAAQLAAYTLAISSLLVAAFNLYLLAWLWHSQAGEMLSPSPVPDQVTFAGPIKSWSQFRASRVRPLNSSQQQELQLASRQSIQIAQISQSSTSNQQQQPQELLTMNRQGLVQFPSGLEVVGEADHAQVSSLSCPGDNGGVCRVSAPLVRLRAPRGVDFRSASISTERLDTQRLHSPTGRLALLSSRSSAQFASQLASVSLEALELVALASRRAQLVIGARLVDVSRLLLNEAQSKPSEQQALGHPSRATHKLCICLHHPGSGNTNNQTKEGLIFGVPSGSQCAKFSAHCGRRRNRIASGSPSRTLQRLAEI